MIQGQIMYEHEGEILAWTLNLGTQNHPGLTFYSSSEDFIQVGIWNHPLNTVLNSHIHNKHVKEVNRTSEVLVVLDGSIHVDLYSESQELVNSAVVSSGEILVCLRGGHGYRILSENTKVLEVKNGPYYGPAIDRSPFPSQCNSCTNT